MFVNNLRIHLRKLTYLKKITPSLHETENSLLRGFSSVIKEFKTALPGSKKLRIDVSCNLNIKPLDPQSQVDGYLIATVHGPENSNFTIDFAENDESLLFLGRSTQSKDSKEITLEIGIPVQYDIDILSKLGNVTVGSFVSDCISVHAENGDINCRKLHCASLFLKSSNGNVNCAGILIGNIRIKTGKHGNINGVNFQGNRLEAETEEGDIFVSSTYSDESYFTTKKGNINLKNLHRRSCVSVEEGNISISGLDGCLDGCVQQGCINVQITRLSGNSYLETKNGDIALSVAKDDVCLLDLSAKKMFIEGNLNSTGKISDGRNFKTFRSFQAKNSTQAVMKAVSENGELNLKEESWVSSLKFGAH